MEKLLIDTGAFYGREMEGDQYYSVAVQAWAQIESNPVHLYSTEHILDETINLLARKSSYAFAAEWGLNCLRSEEFEWLRTASEDLKAAAELMLKYADQDVSFTDCVSFALMRREGIRHAFSFDRHFLAAKFHLWPGV